MKRVAIVGLGMAVTPHARSLLKRFPFPQCDRLETILQDETVDAVLVLTPPHTHLEIVERCAAAGKHVLLEKPLEISTERAERLVRACNKVRLGVVLQHRFRPAAEKLRELMPRLGPLVSASAAIPNWRPQSYYEQPGRGTRARDGGGVLLTQAIHTLDLFLSFTGEPAEVAGFSTTTPVHRMETEDLAVAAVRFKNGALGVVHATTTAYPGFPERIELIGARGTALLEGTSLKVRLQGEPAFEFKTDAGAGGTGADPMAFPHDWHRGVLADFLDAIEQDRQPRVSGAGALGVHRFIDRILRSAG